jgi:hypothetical protein
MTNRFNHVQAPMKERQVIESFIEFYLANLNCVKIGIIESVDLENSRVDVKLCTKYDYNTIDAKEYPILPDVPLIILGGLHGALEFPVAVGDECLVLFNDVCIDNYLLKGEISAPQFPRQHDLNDGFALVGWRSNTNISAIQEDCVSLNAKDVLIQIKNNNSSLRTVIENINTVVSKIEDALNSIGMGGLICAAPESSALWPTWNALKESLDVAVSTLESSYEDLLKQ